MRYRVPLKITFDGCAEIEADDEVEAEQRAIYHISAVLGYVSDGGADCVINTVFDVHGETDRRNNESIEEIEEGEE